MSQPEYVMLNNIKYIPAELKVVLTKREYFAGLALQSLISYYGNENEKEAAIYAIEFADALIKQLNQGDCDD